MITFNDDERQDKQGLERGCIFSIHFFFLNVTFVILTKDDKKGKTKCNQNVFFESPMMSNMYFVIFSNTGKSDKM